MSFILAIIDKKESKIKLLNKDKKQVDFSDDPCIFSYYEANAFHFKQSKMDEFKGLKMINLVNFVLQDKDIVELIKEKMLTTDFK